MIELEASIWSATLARSVSRAVVASEYPNDLSTGESPTAALALLAEATLAIAEGREPKPFTGERWMSRATALSRDLRRAILAERAAGLVGDSDTLLLLGALEQVEVRCATDVAARFAEQLGSENAMDLLIEVAHDLRSPIGSLLLLVDRMRKGQSGPVNAMQERQLGLVYAAAFGLSALTSDLMELARGGTRLVGQRPVTFSISEVMRTVGELVQPIAEEKGLELKLSGPELDARVGHPAALYRVLLNLTTNALKFTTDGEVALRAEAGDGQVVNFSVRDTGRGLPMHVMEHMYETFHRRSRGRDHAFSSTGLGLAICQKLVAAMGSSLDVISSPHAGCVFSFDLELPSATAS